MKFISIALTSILFRSLTVSENDYSMCQDWYRYESKRGVKYIKFPMKLLNWNSAKRFCEGLGGQLLIIRDESTDDFIRHNVKFPHSYNIWFGVSVIDGKMYRVDGRIPNNNDYQHWEEDTIPQNGLCASTNWNSNFSRWRLESCDKKKFLSCEADVPCNSRPAVMIRKDGKRLVKGNINITMEQTINVRCYASGFTANVVKVELICSWNKFNKHIKATSIDQDILFNIRSHMGMCECKIHEKEEKTKEITLTFIFYTSPQFVHDSYASNRIFKVLIGSGFNYPIDIYANPDPEFFQLTFNGTIVDNDGYNMSMEPLSGPLHFRITVSLFNLSVNQSGPYVFAVDNFIKDPLKSPFTLEVVKEIIIPPDDKEHNNGLKIAFYVLISVMTFALISSATTACIKRCKPKEKKVVMEDSTKSTKTSSHDSRPVETETEFSDMAETDIEKETEFDDDDYAESFEGGTTV